MLKSLLQNIGLPQKYAEVYLACLEMGTQPASVIAKKTALKRPTTYMILEGLCKMGLVSEYNGANVKYFTAVSPDYLLTYVERRKRELSQHQRDLEQYLPQLTSLSNPYSLNPKVRFYEGFEGVERVMNDTLTAQEPLRSYSNIDAWFSRPQTRDYILWYGRQRVNTKKLPLRCILTDTPSSRDYFEKDYPDARNPAISHFRWFPQEIPAISNEINIYDNKLAIVSIGKRELLGIVIESESIVDTQKSIFELAWRSSVKASWEATDTVLNSGLLNSSL